jgi:hypothetical protein
MCAPVPGYSTVQCLQQVLGLLDQLANVRWSLYDSCGEQKGHTNCSSRSRNGSAVKNCLAALQHSWDGPVVKDGSFY